MLLLIGLAVYGFAQPPLPTVTTNRVRPAAVPVQTNPPPPVPTFTNVVTVNVSMPSNSPYVLLFRSSNVMDGYAILGAFPNGSVITDVTTTPNAYYLFWPNQPIIGRATNGK